MPARRSKPSHRTAKGTWSRRLLWSLAGLLVLVAGFAGWLAVFPRPPADAPIVVVSLDRKWYHHIGMYRLTYDRMLRRAGLRSRVVDADVWGEPKVVAGLLSDAGGLLLGGGGDVDPARYRNDTIRAFDVDPERDELETELFEVASARGMPILGVCRGAQLLNVLRGGTIKSLRENESLFGAHRRFGGHAVILTEDSSLKERIGRHALSVVFSWHGQALDFIGNDLRVAAHAPDGNIEAVEGEALDEHWIVGVQWHPELQLREKPEHRIIDDFARAVKAYLD